VVYYTVFCPVYIIFQSCTEFFREGSSFIQIVLKSIHISELGVHPWPKYNYSSNYHALLNHFLTLAFDEMVATSASRDNLEK
jgi:hypothetical protein